MPRSRSAICLMLLMVVTLVGADAALVISLLSYVNASLQLTLGGIR